MRLKHREIAKALQETKVVGLEAWIDNEGRSWLRLSGGPTLELHAGHAVYELLRGWGWLAAGLNYTFGSEAGE